MVSKIHFRKNLIFVKNYFDVLSSIATSSCKQWCSGGGATGAIVPVPLFQGGATLQFLFYLFLVNFAYIVQKLIFDLIYIGKLYLVICSIHLSIFLGYVFTPSAE